ncbi:hypothetical protein [Paraburkholderia caballeronis]|uniref:hypothetical protein n=1 Tax=Paraburkholderia caballeronis TaxID=416943 RepID=UPI001064965A|nr:hypothetical protein [Paraburkholderia caballeronis]TDV11661.1 hypothetical protein C7408_11116 [Paraburkholderia caballeronis]TDV14742.1 hypothetical protein C7406_11216 [Paraburkholderia caballeronis]TDV23862.1 hypothetical protein C7404_11116 [Paraburkholderia caballeronis]TDV27250.1 hypothetical protein C7405_11716 [Paraburkholderia caballeronis]
MYIILTSKPGQYRSEATDGIEPVEVHDYFYGERHVAVFVVAAVRGDAKVKIVDDDSPATVNLVPTKFFEHFSSVPDALRSIQDLAGHGHTDARVVRRPAAHAQ